MNGRCVGANEMDGSADCRRYRAEEGQADGSRTVTVVPCFGSESRVTVP